MKLKPLIYFLTLLGILVPFILITDIFPFLRFGMFAEPLDKSKQVEIFYIEYKDYQANWQRFNPEEYQMQDETFQYLARNYYYRKESNLLLQKLKKSNAVEGDLWHLYKISFPPGFPDMRDTVLINTLSL
jgi:hypothetical protein